ncbi:SDR family NAD(P)-dependent oxidoreductase [Gallaecimonas mangrovi]|uniref:SDR family NAD(P)-dependent oxidoreductase n=1 Tax=Gallaecimonas mangrovi TaxID=2291597 RepID=UPI000E209FA0|nr:SDR family NAD(P)-dependent oxidoreductase [Gallaecimonas mangrovi]
MKTALIVGASRGLGLAMAEEFIANGWQVIGTKRGDKPTGLDTLGQQYPNRLRIEPLDICNSEQISALANRLKDGELDMLFVNAGITNRDPNQRIGEVATDDFIEVMVTNALGPMRVVEQLTGKVKADGLIGAMSSGQGSLTNNDNGLRPVYRGSKAVLNMLMKSFACQQGPERALALMAPGWIKTDLGGAKAPYTLAETVPLIVQVLIDKQSRPGLEYLDRFGNQVPW